MLNSAINFKLTTRSCILMASKDTFFLRTKLTSSGTNYVSDDIDKLAKDWRTCTWFIVSDETGQVYIEEV